MNPHIVTLERMENAIHTLLLIGDCPLETAPEDVQAEVEALRAAIALMRGQSGMVMVPRDVVDSIEACVSMDLRPYFETIVRWSEKIKASSEGHSR